MYIDSDGNFFVVVVVVFMGNEWMEERAIPKVPSARKVRSNNNFTVGDFPLNEC